MLYLELYCTDGTGWRLTLRKPANISGGVATFADIPTFTVDHACTLMDEFSIVTDDPPIPGGMNPATGFATLFKGSLQGAHHLHVGDTFNIPALTVRIE